MTEKELEPNYENTCELCDQLPTVSDSGLCSCCFFGEAEALDPDEWNK